MSKANALDFDIDALNFEKGNGLVVIVAQRVVTGMVLMVAHADRQAMEHTIETGEMHYTSRSRGLWHKGATSGNVQRVLSLAVDCDGDAVLARVRPAGPACHTGEISCFGKPASDALGDLAATVEMRVDGKHDGPSYTRKLLDDRNLRLKKIGEEAVELSVACADGQSARIVGECADLFFHALVAARAEGVTLDDVRAELDRRARKDT